MSAVHFLPGTVIPYKYSFMERGGKEVAIDGWSYTVRMSDDPYGNEYHSYQLCPSPAEAKLQMRRMCVASEKCPSFVMEIINGSSHNHSRLARQREDDVR